MKYVSKLVLLAMAVALIGRAAEAQGNGRFDGVDCVRAGDDGRGQACADVSCEDSNQQWPGLNDCEGSQSQVFLRNIFSGADPDYLLSQYVQGMIEAATDGMYTQEQAAAMYDEIYQTAFDAGVERGRVEMGREVREEAADREAVIHQVAFDAGVERGRVEMGREVREEAADREAAIDTWRSTPARNRGAWRWAGGGNSSPHSPHHSGWMW
jgi:hypothetical protein